MIKIIFGNLGIEGSFLKIINTENQIFTANIKQNSSLEIRKKTGMPATTVTLNRKTWPT